MQHKNRARRKLKSTLVQRMLDTIAKRVTDDQTLSPDQLIQLTSTAAQLAATLNAMDESLQVERKKRRLKKPPRDIFVIRSTDQ
jgi:acetyl-CoA carboxylase carboxyltransferase component